MVSFAIKRARLARWTRVVGVLVGHRVRQTFRKGRRRTYHHPIVRYQAAGREWLHESPVGTRQARRQVGDPVPVLHNPAQPDDACIDEVGQKYFVQLLIGTIGAIFTATGAWLLLVAAP
jgi:hypothetical protein